MAAQEPETPGDAGDVIVCLELDAARSLQQFVSECTRHLDRGEPHPDREMPQSDREKPQSNSEIPQSNREKPQPSRDPTPGHDTGASQQSKGYPD
jgi:hypothetical protein